MLTESLVNMLAESPLNILAELLASLLVKTMINIYLKASMNIYLIRYIKHDESSRITLKYFLKYNFSAFYFKTSNWVYNFVVQV